MTTHIAIFSDMHGNIAATEAVLAEIDATSPDAVYCLGDLVGYGAFPNEVTALIRARSIPTIMGNYDDGVGFDRDDCGCAYRDEGEKARGQESLMWTRARTTDLLLCARGLTCAAIVAVNSERKGPPSRGCTLALSASNVR